MRYTILNNKGGTGKTSLSFQILTMYAAQHPNENVLVIDLCPQANLSELLLGGLAGSGGIDLDKLYNEIPRRSIGGYFQQRISNPFIPGQTINVSQYLTTPYSFNEQIPKNISLLAGDKLLEIQSVALTTLANSQLPGVNARLAILDWINDFISAAGDKYDTVFMDTNPSFSIHTQIALAASERLIIPIMADDSSRRAIANVFTLIYGLNLPNPIYNNYLFSSTLLTAGRKLPLVHLIIKNRITQYMGAASAYATVLTHITADIQKYVIDYPQCFTFSDLSKHTVEITDFGTTGVVAFAEGTPFDKLKRGKHSINGRETIINSNMLDDCKREIENIVSFL